MERVSVDVRGPIPKDDYGNTYLLVIIDNFSRYLEIYPMPDKKPKLLLWVWSSGYDVMDVLLNVIWQW